MSSLRQRGLRLAFLTNMTTRMVEAGIRNSGLEGLFEDVLSADRVRAYNPDPRAYQMAIDAFGLARDAIAFAAFGGWEPPAAGGSATGRFG